MVAGVGVAVPVAKVTESAPLGDSNNDDDDNDLEEEKVVVGGGCLTRPSLVRLARAAAATEVLTTEDVSNTSPRSN